MMAVVGLALCAPFALAKVELTSRTEAGATIQGVHRFRVGVSAEQPVRVVECYVDGDLLGTDTSTPYEFDFDTLTRGDGPVSVRFAAYTTENEKGELTLSVKVDNGVALGAEHHLDLARAALTESKWDVAIHHSRVALRAKPGDAGARVALARGYLGKGTLDIAERYLEEVIAEDAAATEALNLLASARIRRAFGTFARADGSHQETLDAMRDALSGAVKARLQALSSQLQNLGPANDDNRLEVADRAIQAGRYSLAVIALTPAFNQDDRRSDVFKRLLYALIQNEKWEEAFSVLARHKRSANLDAYGHALEGILYALLGDQAKSDEAMRAATGNSPGVQTARAFLALRDNKTAALAQIVQSLASEREHSAVVQYYLCALSHRLNQPVEARRYLERGLLAEPVSMELLHERANEIVLFALKTYPTNVTEEDKKAENQAKQMDQFKIAKVFVEAAHAAKEDSARALAVRATIELLMGNKEEALRLAELGARSGPTSALAQYAFSAALSAAGNNPDSFDALQRAGRLDTSLSGRPIPNAEAVWRYFDSKGRTPVIEPPK